MDRDAVRRYVEAAVGLGLDRGGGEEQLSDVFIAQVVEAVRAEPDPRRRIDTLIQVGLTLPHGAEAAIRVWSSVDPEVHPIQAAVDQQRFDIMYESAFEILHNKRQAQTFAAWGVYVLVGYEQAMLARDSDALEWIAGQLLDALDSGRFATVPDGD